MGDFRQYLRKKNPGYRKNYAKQQREYFPGFPEDGGRIPREHLLQQHVHGEAAQENVEAAEGGARARVHADPEARHPDAEEPGRAAEHDREGGPGVVPEQEGQSQEARQWVLSL